MLLFGHGLEKQVDLKIFVQLGEDFRRNIPVLHNGYAYLLLRCGAFGLLSFLIFFVFVFVVAFKKNKDLFLSIILVGLVLSLLISNYVVGTFFSTEISIGWVIIGAYFTLRQNECTRKTINDI